MISKSGGSADVGDGRDDVVKGECDLLRRVRGRRRRVGGGGGGGDGDGDGLSGGIRSLGIMNDFGGGSNAMLANGGQASSSSLSGQTFLVFAAPEERISA